MNLSRVDYRTPTGQTCDIFDADRKASNTAREGLFVARVFEPEYAAMFVAAPDLLAAAQGMLAELSDPRSDPETLAVAAAALGAAVTRATEG